MPLFQVSSRRARGSGELLLWRQQWPTMQNGPHRARQPAARSLTSGGWRRMESSDSLTLRHISCLLSRGRHCWRKSAPPAAWRQRRRRARVRLAKSCGDSRGPKIAERNELARARAKKKISFQLNLEAGDLTTRHGVAKCVSLTHNVNDRARRFNGPGARLGPCSARINIIRIDGEVRSLCSPSAQGGHTRGGSSLGGGEPSDLSFKKDRRRPNLSRFTLMTETETETEPVSAPSNKIQNSKRL